MESSSVQNISVEVRGTSKCPDTCETRGNWQSWVQSVTFMMPLTEKKRMKKMRKPPSNWISLHAKDCRVSELHSAFSFFGRLSYVS
jgi:hypothetical protein